MKPEGAWLGAEPKRLFNFEDSRDDFGPPPSELYQRSGKIWAPEEINRRGVEPVPEVDKPGEWAPWKLPDPDEQKMTEVDLPRPKKQEDEGVLPVEPVIVPQERFEFKKRHVKSKKEASEFFRAPRAFYVDQLESDEEKDQIHTVKYRRDEAQRPKKLGRSVYDALETHGHFGLVDGGETIEGGVRRLVVHVPKRNRGYALDIKPGEVIYANSARGLQVGGRLDVQYVSRHKYVPPGHAVTSCVIGVPYAQWKRFLE